MAMRIDKNIEQNPVRSHDRSQAMAEEKLLVATTCNRRLR